MVPRQNRASAYLFDDILSLAIGFSVCDLLRQVQVIPANNRVLNEASATLNNFLLVLRLNIELLIVTKTDCSGKFVRQFNFAQFNFNDLSHLNIINIVQNKNSFDCTTILLQGLIQWMMLWLWTQPFKCVVNAPVFLGFTGAFPLAIKQLKIVVIQGHHLTGWCITMKTDRTKPLGAP